MRNISLQKSSIWIGIFSFWTLLFLMCSGAFAQTAWTNCGNGYQTRVVGSVREYRVIMTTGYAPLLLTDSLAKKINLADSVAKYITPTVLNTRLATKVDKTTTVNGKALSGNITLTKADVQLGNADNTSDANKPNSNATIASLALKANLASPALTGTPTAPTPIAGTNTTQIATAQFVTAAVALATIPDATTLVKGKIKLAGDLSGTADLPTVPGLANKVDKVTGKGLSAEDFTTVEKAKLAGIAAGAEVNVNSDWNATSGDAQILNKPATASNLGVGARTATTLPITNDNGTGATLPVSTSTLAGLQSGADKAKLDGIATGATANQTDAYLLARANHTGVQAISTVTGLQTALDDKIPLAQKAANNGVATLDASGKVPASQLPISGEVFKGEWNAATNVPVLADGTGVVGNYYLVSVGGTRNLGHGTETYGVGDKVMYNGTIWTRIPNFQSVNSVNGQTGTVVLGKADIGLPLADNTADINKIVSTPQQTAINLKENAANKSNAALGTSTTLFPTQSAVKTYVDNAITANTGASNLAVGTRTSTTLPITNSNGTGVTIPEATTTLLGGMSAADKVKLDGIATGATANVGTVTSVGLAVPSGMTVVGTPVTGAGTLTLGYAAGYGLPTTAKQANWDTAFGWGNHATAGYATASNALTFTNKAGLISQWTNDAGYITSSSIPDLAPYALKATTISAGTGLTGGGDLSANRTISANFGTAAGTIAQGNDSRINNGQTAFGWGNHAGLYLPLFGGGSVIGDVTINGVSKFKPTTVSIFDSNSISIGKSSATWPQIDGFGTGIRSFTLGTEILPSGYQLELDKGGWKASGNTLTTGTMTASGLNINGNASVTGVLNGNASSAIKLATARTINGVLFDGTTDITIPVGTGTVTSVGLTVPTGFAASNTPITTNGSIGLNFDIGYSLPTTANQSNWDTAFGWGNHAGLYAPLNHVGSGGSAHSAVTTTTNGFMTSLDKTKLDGLSTGGSYVLKSGDTMNGPFTVNGSTTIQSGLTSLIFGISGTSLTNGRGISLQNGVVDGMPSAGISYSGTATFGTHGSVLGNTATYITAPSAGGNRGWIFKSVATIGDATGNVASVSATGAATFNGGVTAPTFNGNATTATTLQTARTINGVSFNGSANITIPVGTGTVTSVASTIGGNALNVTGTPITTSGTLAYAWAGTAGQYVNGQGNLVTFPTIPAGTVTGVTSANSNITVATGTTTPVLTLASSITSNAASATVLQTARTINGVSFNGSANITVSDNTKLPLAGGDVEGAMTVRMSAPAASVALDIGGYARALDFIVNSDSTLKKNITPLSNTISKLGRLKGYSYDWKRNGSHAIGVIAQEIQKEYPEVVFKDDKGILNVDYSKLVAPLIQANNEQQKEIDQLKKDIQELKSLIKR